MITRAEKREGGGVLDNMCTQATPDCDCLDDGSPPSHFPPPRISVRFSNLGTLPPIPASRFYTPLLHSADSWGTEDSPYTLKWTPDNNTPDKVYYQCWIHQKLGWEILVEGDAEPTGNANTPNDDDDTGTGCPQTHEFVGRTAEFSELQHRWRGRVTVVDDCSFEVCASTRNGGHKSVACTHFFTHFTSCDICVGCLRFRTLLLDVFLSYVHTLIYR